MSKIFIPAALFFVLIVASHRTAAGHSAVVAGVVSCDSVECSLRDAKIDGEIDSSTVDQVRRLIDQTRAQGLREKKPVSFKFGGFVLHGPGGSVSAALAIGRLFRKERVSVIVPNGEVCYSACVLVLAGAVDRMVFGDVGIHRPYLDVPKQQVNSERVTEVFQQMLQEIRGYFRQMNVSEQLADDMLRIGPANIKLLDEPALNSYGLTATDPMEQETEDLEDAQYWGLDRQEYIKRKSLAERSCPVLVGMTSRTLDCRWAVMKTGRTSVTNPADDLSRYGTCVNCP
jgi:hypothetical protein